MRLSRGRSTPTRRAMWRFLVCSRSGFWSCRVPSRLGWAPASAPEVISVRGPRPSEHVVWWCGGAVALLGAGVLADDHDPAVTADDLALVTDGLDAGVDLHANTSLAT